MLTKNHALMSRSAGSFGKKDALADILTGGCGAAWRLGKLGTYWRGQGVFLEWGGWCSVLAGSCDVLGGCRAWSMWSRRGWCWQCCPRQSHRQWPVRPPRSSQGILDTNQQVVTGITINKKDQNKVVVPTDCCSNCGNKRHSDRKD